MPRSDTTYNLFENRQPIGYDENARYFILEGNAIVLPATMNTPQPEGIRKFEGCESAA